MTPLKRPLSPVLVDLQLDADRRIEHGTADRIKPRRSKADGDTGQQTRMPVYRKIANQLRKQIQSGALAYGVRLPPSRDLSMQLGIARNCVIDAYDELIADGLLEGRGRRGTFVVAKFASGGADVGKRETPRQRMPTLLERIAVATGGGEIDPDPDPDSDGDGDGDGDIGIDRAPVSRIAARSSTRVAAMSEALAHDWRPGQANARSLPLDAWRNACREAGRHLPPQDYGDPRGDLGLRRAIVTWLREHRSVVVQPEQIVVTQGTGLALRLIAQTLLRPGDVCAIEDPGYDGAALAFKRAGAALHYVPVDEDGVIVERLADAAMADAVKPVVKPVVEPVLLHVTPAHQYPMGSRLSGPRRRALVERAQSRAMLIVENEYDCEFHYAGTNHPPIFSHAPESTLLLNTFAKAVSPSLRLGFIAASLPVAAALADCIARERVHVSWPVQKIVESLLVSGELDRHLRRVRRYYGIVRETIRQRLAPYADVVCIRGDEGGLHLIVSAYDERNHNKLCSALRTRGILFNELRDFTSMQNDISGFLFGYGHMTHEALSDALDVLEACIKEVTPRCTEKI